jgi:hypothetical protein
MRTVGIAVVMLSLAGAAGRAAGGEVALFPVVKSGLWGYMDRSGKVAIPPRFECAWDFSEGLACVQIGGKRGYIDGAGKVVIELRYHLAHPFREGRAAVMMPEGTFGGVVNKGRWAYLDATGKVAIPPRDPAVWADDFHEGVARYKTHGSGMDTHVYLTTNGSEWLSFTTGGGIFSEGLAAVPKNRLYGYKNHERADVIQPQFTAAGEFSEGLAPVAVQVASTNAEGKVSSRAAWGFVDGKGAFVVQPRFDAAGRFSEGLAPVAMTAETEKTEAGKTTKTKSLRWGYADKTGKLAVEPVYESAAPFAGGRGRVAAGGKCGFIDRSGRMVIEPAFDAAWEFSQGLARVIVAGAEGYIDESGKYVWPPSK